MSGSGNAGHWPAVTPKGPVTILETAILFFLFFDGDGGVLRWCSGRLGSLLILL